MTVRILIGDVRAKLRELPDESVHCVVTSPPYWGLRDYGVAGQIGLETTPAEYVSALVDVFREVRRVLRADGTLWLNMGDSYATGAGKVGDHPGGGEQGARWRGETTRHHGKGRGTPARADGSGGHTYLGPVQQPNRMPIEGLKPKDLVGIPWRVAFALQADGWWLRQDIIWNPMPESVTDRCTKAHEYLFLLSKSARYYYNQEAILEPASPNTHARLSQDVQNQIGSDRVPGKTNGNMKAVARRGGGNRSHKGTTEYERNGDERHRTKAGLVAFSEKQRKLAEAGSGIKRDGFRCSYCGRHPPDVLLEVDHIVPVCEGGSDAEENLTTACFDCNRGKAGVPLTVVPRSLPEKAAEVAEREEQLAGYRTVMQARADRIEDDMWAVADILVPDSPKDGMRRDWLRSIKTFNERLPLHVVKEAANLARDRMLYSDRKRFLYFCKVCWNKIKEGGE